MTTQMHHKHSHNHNDHRNPYNHSPPQFQLHHPHMVDLVRHQDRPPHYLSRYSSKHHDHHYRHSIHPVRAVRGQIHNQPQIHNHPPHLNHQQCRDHLQRDRRHDPDHGLHLVVQMLSLLLILLISSEPVKARTRMMSTLRR